MMRTEIGGSKPPPVKAAASHRSPNGDSARRGSGRPTVNCQQTTVNAGFTLVELLAAMAILAVAMGLIILPFMSAMDYLAKGRARSEAQQTARQVMATLTRDLSEAMEVQLSPGDPSLVAFVPPVTGTFPLQPSNTIVRYWRILRSNPNAGYLSVTYASGTWSSGNWNGGGSDGGANGNGLAAGTDFPLPGASQYALIGRLNDGVNPPGPPFVIGSPYTSIPPGKGALELSMNDNDFTGNSGSLTLTIVKSGEAAQSVSVSAASWQNTTIPIDPGTYSLTSAKCWYDNFSPDPKLNRATAADTDSRFVGRTEFNPANQIAPGLLSRAVPAKSAPADPIADKQFFRAISPDAADYDIPLLRFDPTSQANETLVRDQDSSNPYVYHSQYPLWEGDWVFQVYDYAGTSIAGPFRAANLPIAGITVDTQRGEVSFAVSSGTVTGTVPVDGIINLAGPPIHGSETVRVGTPTLQTLQETSPTTPDSQHYWFPVTGNAIQVSTTWAGQNYEISYQWSNFVPGTSVVVASYRTRALLNISMTVSKRDAKSAAPQDVHLEQRVRLKNVVR